METEHFVQQKTHRNIMPNVKNTRTISNTIFNVCFKTVQTIFRFIISKRKSKCLGTVEMVIFITILLLILFSTFVKVSKQFSDLLFLKEKANV